MKKVLLVELAKFDSVIDDVVGCTCVVDNSSTLLNVLEVGVDEVTSFFLLVVDSLPVLYTPVLTIEK